MFYKASGHGLEGMIVVPPTIFRIVNRKCTPLLIGHAIVGKSTSCCTDVVTQRALCRIYGLVSITVSFTDAFEDSRSPSTYHSEPYQIVISLEMAYTNSLDTCIRSQSRESDPQSIESPELNEGIGSHTGQCEEDGRRSVDGSPLTAGRHFMGPYTVLVGPPILQLI